MNRSLLAVVTFVIGLLIVPIGLWLYLSYGRLPVAVADAPFPFEAKVVKVPLRARINSEMATSAVPVTDDNLTAGAEVYQHNCAFCHGLPNVPSPTGKAMYPSTPQLWVSHRKGVVGVSDDPIGETYWKVKNGIRLTGMPAFNKLLNDTQMWQVSLLLSQADKPIPTAASKFLTAEAPTHP